VIIKLVSSVTHPSISFRTYSVLETKLQQQLWIGNVKTGEEPWGNGETTNWGKEDLWWKRTCGWNKYSWAEILEIRYQRNIASAYTNSIVASKGMQWEMWPTKSKVIVNASAIGRDPNHWIEVIWARFSTLPGPGLLRWFLSPKKSSKFDINIFSLTDKKQEEWHHKQCGYVSGEKLSHSGPISNFTFIEPAMVVAGPEKVVKIQLKHCTTVLTGNDKNCTPVSVGMFRAQNRVI